MRKGSHTVSRLSCHIVWSTKYRYKVLRGDTQFRCRELLIFEDVFNFPWIIRLN